MRIQPKVVDAGHHQRRLIRLTGLDTEENQARRLLNDLDYYRAATDQQGADEAIVAHQWLTEMFEPVVQSVPERPAGQARAGRGSTTRCWSTAGSSASRPGRDVDHRRRAQLHGRVLRRLPDEEIALSAMESMGPLANPFDPSQGFADEQYEKPYDPWEDGDEARRSATGPGGRFLDIAALRAKAKKWLWSHGACVENRTPSAWTSRGGQASVCDGGESRG